MATLAHLILVGGRPIPNLLSARVLAPALIVPIASKESQNNWPRLRPVFAAPGVTLADPFVADAFDPHALRDACQQALALAPDAKWIGNVTCGTTPMSIVAYEVLRETGHTTWYLDTAGRRVITLSGRQPSAHECEQMFQLPFHLYAGIYGRTVDPYVGTHRPPEALLTVARMLGQEPQLAMEARQKLRDVKIDTIRANETRTVTLAAVPTRLAAILQQAANTGLALSCDTSVDMVTLHLKGNGYWHFINGGWLEIYAGDAARNAGVFTDVRVGVEIPAEGVAKNEIDLAAMAGTLLLVAECKSGTPDTVHLDTIGAVANMLGNKFVTRLYIMGQTAESLPAEKWNNIRDQAAERQIVVVHGGELPRLQAILRREVEHPTYKQH